MIWNLVSGTFITHFARFSVPIKSRSFRWRKIRLLNGTTLIFKFVSGLVYNIKKMKCFLNKYFISTEAVSCFGSVWKFWYLITNIPMRNRVITTVPISVDFDVRCNVFKTSQKHGFLAYANSTSNNNDSPCILVVHAFTWKITIRLLSFEK